MKTPSKRLSLPPEGMNNICGKIKKKRNYTKKNPPNITERSGNLRIQDIMEKGIEGIASNPTVWNYRYIKNLTAYYAASGCHS